MDQVFHVDCFTCIICNNKLRGQPFYAVEKKAYCEPCYIVSSDLVLGQFTRRTSMAKYASLQIKCSLRSLLLIRFQTVLVYRLAYLNFYPCVPCSFAVERYVGWGYHSASGLPGRAAPWGLQACVYRLTCSPLKYQVSQVTESHLLLLSLTLYLMSYLQINRLQGLGNFKYSFRLLGRLNHLLSTQNFSYLSLLFSR